jgi:hypothetical protein
MDANPIERQASDRPEIETSLVRRDMRHYIQMELTPLARSRVPAGAAHLER